MFFSSINSTIQRILSNVCLIYHTLNREFSNNRLILLDECTRLRLNSSQRRESSTFAFAVNQAFFTVFTYFFRDILESQNDTAFSAVIDKRAMHSKVTEFVIISL